MINNIIKSLILIFILIFFILVFNYYFSEKNIGLVKHNRVNPEEKIRSNIGKLPVLSNDTSNVIEFNSGFENSNNKNYKRSFWELFK